MSDMPKWWWDDHARMWHNTKGECPIYRADNWLGRCPAQGKPGELERCERCGRGLKRKATCACPGPRCPWCRRRLDDDGCCPSLPVVGCWAGGLIIPIPDVA